MGHLDVIGTSYYDALAAMVVTATPAIDDTLQFYSIDFGTGNDTKGGGLGNKNDYNYRIRLVRDSL